MRFFVDFTIKYISSIIIILLAFKFRSEILSLAKMVWFLINH